MELNYNDGGRSKYFKADKVGDCVTRAIAIATQRDYKEVYNGIKKICGYTPRNGVKNRDLQKVVKAFGGIWHACMGIGTGCTMHMNEAELPEGIIIVNVSHHLSCVINGVINDTFDCSRHGKRCVYGYWTFADKPKIEPTKKAKKQNNKVIIEASEDLEIAANKYAGVNYDCETESSSFYHIVQMDAFKAGAQWYREQMMKKAEQIRFDCSLPYKTFNNLKAKGIEIGDKLLIIKE